MKYQFSNMTDEDIRAITILKNVNSTMSVNNRLKIHIVSGTNGILSFVPNNPRVGKHTLMIPYVDAINIDASHKIGVGWCYLGEGGVGWLGAYIIDDAGTDKWQIGYKGTTSTTITQLGVDEVNANVGDKVLVIVEVSMVRVTGSLVEREVSFTVTVYINGTILGQQVFAAANNVPHNLSYMSPGFVLQRIAGTLELELTSFETGFNDRMLEVI